MVKSIKPNTGLKGIDIVLSNLNKEIAKMKIRSAKGLIEAAVFVRRDMDKTSPTIPVDLGNLRASWRTALGKGTLGPFMLMGFTANYAAFVHEMVDPITKFSRPGSGAHFFSNTLKRNKEMILKLINKEAKIK